MSARAGRIYLLLDGVQRSAKGAFKIEIGGRRKQLIDTGGNGHHGNIELDEPGMIEGVITDAGDLSIRELQDFEGTVTIELISGKRYVGTEYVQTNKIPLDTKEGELPVKFEGGPLDESLA